jgi:uncharacterized protein (DUF3084 family)
MCVLSNASPFSCALTQANKFAGWFATSAKENINVEEAVGALVDKILQNAERNCLLERSQGPSLDERVRSLELYRELHGNEVRLLHLPLISLSLSFMISV